MKKEALEAAVPVFAGIVTFIRSTVEPLF